MTALSRALSAELLKTKRTLTIALAFLAPLSLIFLELAMALQADNRLYPVGGHAAWAKLNSSVIMLWELLLLPLFITLEMGLLGAVEHGNKTWKQLYALPIPRWSIYAAKQLVGMGVIGLSMVILLGLTVGLGLLLGLLRPGVGFADPIPWGEMLRHFGLGYLASWLMISIHLFVSLRWPSFVLAMGVGIVATVAGVMVIDSEWLYNYYPWVMPGAVSFNINNGHPLTIPLLLGLGGGIVMALVGGWRVARRDVL